MELNLLALQDVMLSAMTGNPPLGETMYVLCSEVQRMAPDVVLAAVRLDSDRRMRPIPSPSLPSGYDAALDGMLAGPETGTCGPAMMSGEAVLTRDIREDPNWRMLAHLVEPLGLRACWSHPVKDQSGRVLGSLAFYFRQPGEPGDAHVKLAEACLRLCSLAFELEDTHSSLQRLAYFDALTGLPNRGMLEREAGRILAQTRRAGASVGVLMIDVDHFKRYNDTHGHLAGDKALRLIANCIAGGVPHPGDIAGRYGGEEFCVVLQDADPRESIAVAESIRLTIEEELHAKAPGVKTTLTVSIGVSNSDEHAEDSFEDLIERADRCLYEAKRTGRNRVVGPRLRSEDVPQGQSGAPGFHDSREMPGAIQLDEVAYLYGDDLAPEMAALAEVLQPDVEILIDEFYEQLSDLKGVGKLIRSLAQTELVHLKRRQAGHLMLSASAGLTASKHRASSMRAGRIHTLFGMNARDLAHSQELLQAVVSRRVDANTHHFALAVLSRRLSRCLTWQIEASRLVWENSREVLLRTTELAWSATSHTDLIDKAATILGALDGSVGCSFGRPGVEGIFRFESVSGDRLKAYFADIEATDSSVVMKGAGPQGQGPTGRAWLGGQVERCINFETDQRMGPWREIARRHGIRSSVAIPLCPPDRTPSTVLSLYSDLPGGYSSAEQASFIRQVQAVMTFAIARVESGSRTSQALPWSTRQRWAGLIGTSALEMHYQPIRDLRSGRVDRAEALVRLRDGDDTLSPGKFFPCLSREDFVVVYTQGLHQVLSQQNRWLREGLDILVSANLPAEALFDPRYYDITREALRRYGSRPQRLMLEVLETSGTGTSDCERYGLEKFRSLGIKLAEDDLGAGHSSLDRLRALPFDVIKLDRSLIQGVERTPIDVLSSIYQLTNLCHALGKSVVVEGVESVDLIDAVALLGADAVQGYAVARPMPAARFTDWIRLHGATYQIPDRMYPRGYLAKLAKLLIWESHVQLLFGSAQSRVLEFSDGHTPVLPFRMIDPELQTSLLGAAMNHGIAGSEYHAAREKLIAVLSR
ncbi:diguanylate cyclase [Paraburkholderia denitrificans]|uniref:Diguanylate cyclase n=1 Tax=Paraburkholderia denitrificans TaxID=694025 RepID=A0ABW0J2R9_9BURK